MKRNDISNERIKELTIELEDDLKLNEVIITEKALKCPGIKTKWIQIYYEEKKRLNNLNLLKEQLKERYIQNYGQEGVPKIKTINESEKSEDIIKISKEIYKQVETIEFLKDIIDIVIKNFGYDISTAKELIKIEQ